MLKDLPLCWTNNSVFSAVSACSTYAIPIDFFNEGEGLPEVVSPTSCPSFVKILQCSLTTPASFSIKPTLLRIFSVFAFTYFCCVFNASSPINGNLESPLLRLWTVHMSVASKGVVFWLISCPWRHKPASRRSESLAPNPAKATSGFERRAFVMATTLGPVELSSKPSSPV